MRPKMLPAAAAALALALAACSSSAKPLSARELAAKIPRCMITDVETAIPAGGPVGSPVQDVTCTLPDFAQVILATFANARDERQWIADGGFPLDPAPINPSCCIQGNGWAATVDIDSSGNIDFGPVIKALGGRAVHAAARR